MTVELLMFLGGIIIPIVVVVLLPSSWLLRMYDLEGRACGDCGKSSLRNQYWCDPTTKEILCLNCVDKRFTPDPPSDS